MFPTLWYYLIVTLVFFHSTIGYTDASDEMKQPISMTADGWKPIIGSSHPHPPQYQEEIKYYQNPILKETVRAETLPTTTPLTTGTSSVRPEKKIKGTLSISATIFNPGSTKGKIPPHTKQSPQYFVLPRHGSHGPHIPLNAVTQGRPGQHGVLKKGPIKSQHSANKWIVKKHSNGQLVPSQSSRNEVYVPAPSPGSYSFLSQGKNVRTKESSGLGTVGHKLFSIKQPHSHLDYSNHFPAKNLYHQSSPIPHIFFQKQQNNEIIPSHQMDTPLNLLPPPIFKNFDKNQMRHVNPHLNPEIHTPNDKIIFGHNPLGPNDLILQLPSYDQSIFGFGKPKPGSPSAVQITKEKLKTFHNEIPPKFNTQPIKEFDENYHSFQKPITEYPKSPTYEVTESKWEDNTPLPNRFHKPNMIQPVELNFPPFLPTPYKPDIAISTSPTQEEVSTIFGQLSNNVKQYSDLYTHDPYLFDVKEVSTHYPILGTPGTISTTKDFPEGATGKPVSKVTTEEIPTTTEEPKQETIKPKRIHSNNRRRRPTTRYTTTTQQPIEDITENESVSNSYTTEEIETERPYRSRRPVKIRPTPSNSEEEFEEVQKFNRRENNRKRPHKGEVRKKEHRKRVRPNKIDSEEEFPPKANKVTIRAEDVTVLPIVHHFTTQNIRNTETTAASEVQTEFVFNKDDNVRSKEYPHYYSDEEFSQETTAKNNNEGPHNKKKPNYDHEVSTSFYENDYRNEDTISPTLDISKYVEENEETTNSTTQLKEQNVSNTTTSFFSSSTSRLYEDELESTTIGISEVHSSENTDIYNTTISEPTTTVPSTTSTKSHRRRPIKYKASNRPRFSVKDYRQRLNQYSSTTTTEPPKSSTDSVRLRFPTRLRRPLSTTVTTQASDETTRTRFTPKEPRHGQIHSAANDLIKEKNVKAVNTRLRPFGRTKTTTEQPSTVSSKVSIKPNLFSNRRRPMPISLKSRIANRNNTKMDEIKENDVTTITNNSSGSSSLLSDNTMSSTGEKFAEPDEDSETTLSSDILKNDAFMHSQRVSDLTSSMKDAYEGFKTIPTSSRRIPNYYKISTEDPILPIEAFFSNINEKDQ